ncbi:MAG: hypothetical protein HOP31_13495 [Ignavibacteria bacterium]|nr:hypothetical protein [Ignavibacteria bacterium]
MPVSNELFDVIRVMTRKEKSFFRRYFRLHSAGRDGSVMRLFEKLAEYSAANDNYEEDIIKLSVDEPTLRHFAVTKNNLYNLILKSLTEYRRENSNENKVKDLLEQHDILFSMSLLKQADGVLKKAKKIAAANDFFMEINAILNRERTLARYMLDAEGYSGVVERAHKEQTKNLERLKNLSEMNDLGSRITLLLQKYPTAKTRDEAGMKEMDDIFDNPLLSDESKMLSSITLKRFYNLNVVLNEWAGEYEASLKFAKKYADEVEKDVLLKKASLHEFIIGQYSVLTTSVRSGNMEIYETAYSKLADFHLRFQEATERDRLEASYILGLSVFSASADNYHPERGETMLIDADENIKKYERVLSIQQRIVWYFVIARFCFALANYVQAGKWLNRLIQLPNIDVSQDYQCYARIMNLVVAYESGNPDRIEHELRRAYYFLTKRNKVYKYEKIILEYIRQAFRVRSQREINEMLELMHRDLSAIFNDPFEKNAFDAFNVLPWLEGKIQMR